MLEKKIKLAILSICGLLLAAVPSCTSGRGDADYALMGIFASRGKFHCGAAVDPGYFGETDYVQALTGYFN